jgi:hypothetical protein
MIDLGDNITFELYEEPYIITHQFIECNTYPNTKQIIRHRIRFEIEINIGTYSQHTYNEIQNQLRNIPNRIRISKSHHNI